jgi:hypothetical protein
MAIVNSVCTRVCVDLPGLMEVRIHLRLIPSQTGWRFIAARSSIIEGAFYFYVFRMVRLPPLSIILPLESWNLRRKTGPLSWEHRKYMRLDSTVQLCAASISPAKRKRFETGKCIQVHRVIKLCRFMYIPVRCIP